MGFYLVPTSLVPISNHGENDSHARSKWGPVERSITSRNLSVVILRYVGWPEVDSVWMTIAKVCGFFSSSEYHDCITFLQPGGSLFITTINRTWLSHLLVITAAEKILKIVPDGTHEWDKFVPPDDLEFLLDSSKLYLSVRSDLATRGKPRKKVYFLYVLSHFYSAHHLNICQLEFII